MSTPNKQLTLRSLKSCKAAETIVSIFIRIACTSTTVGIGLPSSEEVPSSGPNIIPTTFCSRPTTDVTKGTTASGGQGFAIFLWRRRDKGSRTGREETELKRKGEKVEVYIEDTLGEPLVPRKSRAIPYPAVLQRHAPKYPTVLLHV